MKAVLRQESDVLFRKDCDRIKALNYSTSLADAFILDPTSLLGSSKLTFLAMGWTF